MANTEEPEKIDTILEAATKRFGHYGLAKTTMNEIAADIGMSKAALYYYFPDKEHLFAAVMVREMDRFFEEMEKVMARPESATRKLNHFVESRFAYFRQFINLAKITSAHIDNVKPAFAKVQIDFGKRERKVVQDILQAGISEGEISKLDVGVHADLFVSTLSGFRTLIVKQRDSFMLTGEDYQKLSEYQNLFTKIFIKGISKTVKH